MYLSDSVCVSVSYLKQVRKVLWTRKGVRATVVTADHCTHAELTSGHALASCLQLLRALPGSARNSYSLPDLC